MMHELSWIKGMEIGVSELDILRHRFVIISNKITLSIGDKSSKEDIIKDITEIEGLIASMQLVEQSFLNKTLYVPLKIALEHHIKILEKFVIKKQMISSENIDSYKLFLSEYLSRWYYENIAGNDLVLRSVFSDSGIDKKYNNVVTRSFNKFVHSISIKKGMPIIILFLVLPSLVLTTTIINDASQKVSTYQNILHMSDLYLSVSGTIHEVQQERGMSSALIASGGSLFEKELSRARKNTDKALISTLKKLVENENKWNNVNISEYLKEVKSIINILDMLRQLVDSKQISHIENNEVHTGFINKLLQLSDNMERLDTDASVRNTISALNTINHMKEAAGLERSIGVAGFGGNNFDKEMLQKLSLLVAKQEIEYKRFISLVTSNQLALFKQLIDRDLENELNEFRILAYQDINDFKDNDISTVWWEFTTYRINQYSTFSQQLLALLSKEANDKRLDSEQQVVFMIALSVVLVGVVWLITSLLMQSFRRPIMQVANAMDSLAKGNHEVIISESNKINEIGVLIRAYETFRMRLLRAQLADKIFTETKLSKRIHDIELRKEIEAGENYKREALEDFLTGVPNRRALLIYAENVLKKCKGRKGSISLLMLDIDNFKKINDSYGHAVGDQVIKMLAEQSSALLREEDMIARIGGEEFAILLPNTSIEEASIIAKRIIEKLSLLELKIANNTILRFTVSIGVADVTENILNIEQLLSNADEALYEAKQTGKNKAVIYT